MLSFIALWTFIIGSPWMLLSHSPSSEKSIIARPLPRIRFTLRNWAIAVVILAIDFAMNSFVRSFPGAFERAMVCDTVVILVSALVMTRSPTTPSEIWVIGAIVGVLGMLSFPSLTGH
jgi:hypothetical protein